MSMTPIQPIEQPAGFTFDSMDFAMSRSSACLIQVKTNNPTMDDLDEEDSEDQLGKDEVSVEVDEDLDEKDDQHGEREEDEVYSDDEDEFEQKKEDEDRHEGDPIGRHREAKQRNKAAHLIE